MATNSTSDNNYTINNIIDVDDDGEELLRMAMAEAMTTIDRHVSICNNNHASSSSTTTAVDVIVSTAFSVDNDAVVAVNNNALPAPDLPLLTRKEKQKVLKKQQEELQRQQEILTRMYNNATDNIRTLQAKKMNQDQRDNVTAHAANKVPKELRSHCNESKTITNYWSIDRKEGSSSRTVTRRRTRRSFPSSSSLSLQKSCSSSSSSSSSPTNTVV